jgi:dTDP-4-dehydrorhamnose reductase
MRILLTGAQGQLGRSIQKMHGKLLPEGDIVFTDLPELDITDAAAVTRFVKDFNPDYILNCAAYTAVDKAESDAENVFLVNALAPKVLALAAHEMKAGMIHISTDYVFDGQHHRPYTEEHPTGPQGVYGKSKLEGEMAVRQSHPRALIIRTSWLYSEFGHNFVKTMRRLGSEKESINVVADQIGNPTWATDLASAILHILAGNRKDHASGIYHYTNEGIASWYDLAVAVMSISDLHCKVSPIRTEEYPVPAPRPCYSALDKSKIKHDFGLSIPHWRESLEQCIRVLSEQAASE